VLLSIAAEEKKNMLPEQGWFLFAVDV
jgi:hypothetical protein